MSFSTKNDLSASNITDIITNVNKSRNLSNAQDYSVDRFIYNLKIITVGDPGVGKTSLIKSFTQQEVSSQYQCTVTPESCLKKITIDALTGAELTIWDTCGQEKFRSMTRQYYKDANGILLVYDITNKKSFTDLPNWMKDIKENSPENVSILLVGNKIDLVRNVSSQEANEYAEREGILYAEVSSIEGRFVETPFQNIVVDIINKIKASEEKDYRQENRLKNTIRIGDDNQLTSIEYFQNERKREKETSCC